jgi:amidase
MVGHSLAGAVTPSDVSVIGPLARSAADLDVALTLLAGADPADSAATTALPPPRASALAELRVAVWPEDPAAPTDPEITAEIVALADFLRSRGAAVTFTRPAFDATENYELFVQLLAAAIAPRFGPDALAAARDRAAADPHGTSADAIMDRTFDLPHREWLVLSERRHRLRRTWNAFFRDFDVLLCPPFGTPALPHDTLTQGRSRQVTVNDQTIPYNNLGFWPGVIGAFHLPATVAPLGLTAAGLPIGVQIVGAMHADRQTIAVAAMLEAQWRSFTPPPSIDAAMPR